jgi:hypothetical protein
LKIHFNIILPSISRSFNCSLSLLSTSPLPHKCYMPRPFTSSWINHSCNIWWGVQRIMLLVV